MYQADPHRYDTMPYRRCGRSGLRLPAVSLGLWHNFGDTAPYDNMRAICRTAFDHGITHFDLADTSGPEPGAAERNFGRILREDFRTHRDELIISTKAGYLMWEGPYGDFGSRKHLLAGLDQSLRRMGLDYVDIFYHHRMDPATPLEETMEALAQAVRSGKALYVGLSNYDGPTLEKATAILDELHCPFVICQNRYSLFDRKIEENGLKESVGKVGKGLITFSPLAQGRLTDRYLHGIPADSRIRTDGRYLKEKGALRNNTVVTTIMSNFGLYKAFDELGIDYEKTQVGDKYVYENMVKNGHRIGGEQSGHIIFSKYATTGDGILTAIKMMEVMLEKKSSLATLTSPVRIYPQVLKNVRVKSKPEAQNDADVQAAVKQVAETLGSTGRILVRESGTEPVIRVMVEAETEKECEKYVDSVIDVIKEKGHCE